MMLKSGLISCMSSIHLFVSPYHHYLVGLKCVILGVGNLAIKYYHNLFNRNYDPQHKLQSFYSILKCPVNYSQT